MPVDLRAMVTPDRTAVLTMEMQRGIIGDLASLPELAQEVAELHVIDHTAQLVRAAREAGVRVVHCLVQFRPDRAGSAINTPMLAAMTRNPEHLLIGSSQAELVRELGPDEADIISARSHGLSPFSGTSLDITLRNLRVDCVVATGVSVNLGILGVALEAVNHGYGVVVATDAVAGYPRDYAEAVMKHTIALLATRASVREIIAAWAGPA